MGKCPSCGYENPPGTMYCVACGEQMPYDAHTPVIGADKLLEEVKRHQARHLDPGSYGAPHTLHFQIQGVQGKISIPIDQEITIGRTDRSGEQQPDVDLAPYGALEKGVSRIHAAIRHYGNVLMLVDLGSTNGTSLNSQRLSPEKPRILKDGDEIRLGRLVMRVFFE